jgi:hypothetical protein
VDSHHGNVCFCFGISCVRRPEAPFELLYPRLQLEQKIKNGFRRRASTRMARKLTGNLLIMMSRRRLASDALRASNLHASGSAGGGQRARLCRRSVCTACAAGSGRRHPAQQGRKQYTPRALPPLVCWSISGPGQGSPLRPPHHDAASANCAGCQ